jgi:hypothetical protein
MIRLEGATLPTESSGAIPPILLGDLLRDVPGIPLQIGYAAALAKNCGITATDMVLDLADADIVTTMRAVPNSGVVQIDDEWIQYRAKRTSPPGLLVEARGSGGTTAAVHAEGASVLFVETRAIFVLAYVPPGCAYPPDALVELRVNDGTQFPASTVRLADDRIVPGVRLVTVEFDASRTFGGREDPKLPSTLTVRRGGAGMGGDAGTGLVAGGGTLPLYRMGKAGGPGFGRMLGAQGVVSTFGGRRGGGGGPGHLAAMPPPAAVSTRPAPSSVAAPFAPPTRAVIRLSHSPLGRVTADLRGLCDTAAGRYTGTPNASIVIPAHVVRLLMEETFRETNRALYHAPTWAATAARQAARGIRWRLVWTGDSFEGFRAAAQLCGQADLYLDEDGLWRYAYRDPVAPAVGTVTPRELLGDPGVGWTSGREVTTELEVAWGDGADAGSFTLDSPAMANRHGRNHGALALPYAATESVARLLARYELSRRDRPRQGTTIQTSHAFLGLTLRDRVFVETPLLRIYGAGRIPYDVIGVTDRGDQRVLTLLESDPLALEVLLSGSLGSLTTLTVLLSGSLGAAELAATLSGTLIRPATPLSRTLTGVRVVAATPLSRALAGTLAETAGGVLSVPLAGTLLRPATPLSRTLSGTWVRPGTPLSRALAGTLVRPATSLSRALAGTLLRPATPLSPTLTGTLEGAPPTLAWDAVGATWDAAGAKWDDAPVTPPTLGHVTTVGDTGTSTDTVQAFTTAADETYLLVCIGIRGPSMSSLGGVTFGATALAALKDQLDTSGNLRATLYGGPVPAGTTANVTVDYVGGNANAAIAIRAYKGVASVGTAVAAFTAAATSLSVTLSGVTNARCVDFIVVANADTSPTLGAGQATEFTQFQDGGGQIKMAGSFENAEATMQWTGLTHANDDAVMIAIPLLG